MKNTFAKVVKPASKARLQIAGVHYQYGSNASEWNEVAEFVEV